MACHYLFCSFHESLEKCFQFQEQTIIVSQIRDVFWKLANFANHRHNPAKQKLVHAKFQTNVIWHQIRTSSEGFIFFEVVGEAMELSLEADVENSSVEKFIDST